MRRRPKLRTLSLAAAGLAAAYALAPGPLLAGWEEGKEAFAAGRWAEAAKEFRGVVDQHPDYAQGHFMLGSALVRLGRPADAVASLSRAAELEASEPRYALSLAQAQLAGGDPQAALATLGRRRPSALPEDLRQPYTALLAGAAVRSADPAAAATALEAALAEVPDAEKLWQALARVREDQGRIPEAFAAYARAFELEPADPDPGRQAVALAFAAAKAREGEERREWYRKAAGVAQDLARTGDGAEHRLEAGEAWLGAGDYDAAREWFAKAHEAAPGEPLPLYYLGRCSLALGEPGKALAHLEAARAAGPEGSLAAEVHSGLGLAHRTLEQFPEAARAYRAAGDPEKAAEMDRLAAAAANNAAYDQKVRECRAEKARLDTLREETRGSLGPADQEAFDRQLQAALAECAPYLEEEGVG